MMKQKLITSTLALALGLGGVAGVADVDKAHAAEDTQGKYIVQHGDTLNKISQKYNVSVQQIKQWNGLSSDLILVGQKLTVHGGVNTQVKQAQPAKEVYTPQQNQTQQQDQVQQQPTQTSQNQGQQIKNVQYQKPTQHAQNLRPNQQQQSNVKNVQYKPVQKTQQVSTQSAPQSHNGGGSVRLANGNTAGSQGSSAAAEMAKRTGVPASTWEHIIARESNGDPNAQNASGAAGLFQTMPGHGSTATVQDQINAAEHAYKAQGLSAWGM